MAWQSPPALNADMKPGEIADKLERLQFHDDSELKAVWLDSSVRDFIVRTLARQAAY